MSSLTPSPQDARRWRRYLADERAEAQVYRNLAERREGEEREILLGLAEAEKRHEQHWVDLLGDEVGKPVRAGFRNRALGALAQRFGSVFVLALAQNAESRTPYFAEAAATPQMAADEMIHEEVLRGLAARGRAQMTGNFRAAVFGANDGLVSNLALVMGMAGTGAGPGVVLAAGIAGLLAGALSMGAGEYISVQSARELLAASRTSDGARDALSELDLEENELMLVYRSRGMSPGEASVKAREVMSAVHGHPERAVPSGAMPDAEVDVDREEAMGSAVGAASSSFAFFASGALIPVLPFLFGMSGYAALAVAAVLVGVALMITGSVVGLLSGASPLRRALRQLAIGYGAAVVTYLLGLAFGATGLVG
ncbi:VIT1/CCC1 family protein [Ornithinimicrobium sp. F0845]|uniref:VIT1/CCC1 transporter family protein n=1 Tax=Ornithinimicrobium sp. F0845 TaxID=2926412 RepID=UPI001FF30A02|nr:VIT1/CCC1 family protein [Ornithinimicrobium sp. F0845]MCK0114093.1 VIT1/CCC1 family protein [Ornithinimicrobium sp. F0845]